MVKNLWSYYIDNLHIDKPINNNSIWSTYYNEYNNILCDTYIYYYLLLL